jgi:hypothetical protein
MFPMVSTSHSQLKGQIKHLYKALIQGAVGSPGSHMNAKDEVPYFQQLHARELSNSKK